jgi:peptidylprolyl isomerase
VKTLKEGAGDETLALGMAGRFHYTGWLAGGEVFDSSRFNPRGDETAGHGEPREFSVREGGLIEGWTLGLPGMKVGEVRRLVVPPELGYGAAGNGSSVPPNSMLTFEVELVEIVKR